MESKPSAPPPQPQDETAVVQARGSFRVGDATIELEVALPAGPTSARAILPMLRAFSGEVVAVAEHREAGQGRQVSCRAGCGACCRQLVPLSMTESRQLPDLIDDLEPAHRDRVRARFDAAVLRLRQAGLLPRLERLGSLDRAARVALGLEYFALGIACPFLEDESCSIHRQRPLTCREYLVTSDPAHCSRPGEGQVVGVAIDASVLNALIRAEAPAPGAGRYLPLTLAPYLRPAAAEPLDTGPGWVRRVIKELSGADVGDVGDAATGLGAVGAAPVRT